MPDSTNATLDAVPTDKEIGASDVVATIFIERRIARLKAKKCEMRIDHKKQFCPYCFSRTERIGELEDLL
jgi:hypothetical protein